jgi:hypothetical protein
MANSAGGVLIYGIAEPDDKAKRHLPERLDPLRRTDVSKEWLEQIIQTIQPHIDGVVIHPVAIDEQVGLACYVVEVPQSHTAHQARDHVYYKRHNFNSLPMEDYEVRDVMNRRAHPKLQASIFINKRTSRHKPEGLILVKLENVGRVLAQHIMVELELPVDVDGEIAPDGDDVLMDKNEEGDCLMFRLVPGFGQAPIFPGSHLTLCRKIHTDARSRHVDGTPIVSARHVKVSVYADEMTPLRASLDVRPVITGWTRIEQPSAS